MPETLDGRNEDFRVGIERLEKYALNELRTYPPAAQDAFWRGILQALIVLKGSNSHPTSSGVMTYYDDDLSEMIRKGFEHFMVSCLFDGQQNKQD